MLRAGPRWTGPRSVRSPDVTNAPPIADARYVSLITYRRNGDAVPVPVWIAPLADGRAGFTTGALSGKVKRIRHTPGVVLRPCDMRGKVADGAEEVAATASVHEDDDDARAVAAAIGRKYGLQARLLTVGAWIGDRLGRKDRTVTVVLSFD